MSGRRTVTGEVRAEAKLFGRLGPDPPAYWWLQCTTTTPTDADAGTAVPDVARTRIRNDSAKWRGSRPRSNASGIWTARFPVETIVRGVELWTEPTGGERWFWGAFYDPETGDALVFIMVPARKGIVFRKGRFLYYEE